MRKKNILFNIKKKNYYTHSFFKNYTLKNNKIIVSFSLKNMFFNEKFKYNDNFYIIKISDNLFNEQDKNPVKKIFKIFKKYKFKINYLTSCDYFLILPFNIKNVNEVITYFLNENIFILIFFKNINKLINISTWSNNFFYFKKFIEFKFNNNIILVDILNNFILNNFIIFIFYLKSLILFINYSLIYINNCMIINLKNIQNVFLLNSRN